jgi:hypothetical protein
LSFLITYYLFNPLFSFITISFWIVPCQHIYARGHLQVWIFFFEQVKYNTLFYCPVLILIIKWKHVKYFLQLNKCLFLMTENYIRMKTNIRMFVVYFMCCEFPFINWKLITILLCAWNTVSFTVQEINLISRVHISWKCL